MKIIHRQDTTERQHFLIDKKYAYSINPKLLYCGLVKRKKGWAETEHQHEFIEIMLITKGEGEIYIDKTSYIVTVGDIIIYNARVSHKEISSNNNPLGFEFIACNNVFVDGLKENEFMPKTFPPIFKTLGKYPQIKQYFDIILYELSKKELYYDEVAENALKNLVVEIYRTITTSYAKITLRKSSDLLKEITTYLDLNFTKPLTLSQIATDCYANKFYVNHLFKNNMEMTITDYIRKKRIDYAKQLLSTPAPSAELSITTIAEMSGFPDLNYFCRVFKKETSLTPKTFRQSKVSNDN